MQVLGSGALGSLDWWGSASGSAPPPPVRWLLKFSMWWGWLTHGELALEAQVDILAVVEHRLILARERSEWARLREKGLATIWVPASWDSSHVGNAGVGVISMRGAPVFCLLVQLLSLGASLTAVVRSDACCIRVLAGSCTWYFCSIIKVLILMLSSLLDQRSCSMLLWVSWE